MKESFKQPETIKQFKMAKAAKRERERGPSLWSLTFSTHAPLLTHADTLKGRYKDTLWQNWAKSERERERDVGRENKTKIRAGGKSHAIIKSDSLSKWVSKRSVQKEHTQTVRKQKEICCKMDVFKCESCPESIKLFKNNTSCKIYFSHCFKITTWKIEKQN